MEAAAVDVHPYPLQADTGPKSEEKIRLIFEEAFELGFLICNTLYEDYSVSKILHVVDQLIPTAIILETAYWIFFFPSNGDSMCICKRYHIPCKHVRSKFHWLDLNYEPCPDEDMFRVERRLGYIGLPINFALDIVPETARSMQVFINFHIQSCVLDKERVAQFRNVSPLYTINMSFSILPERKYPTTNLIQFIPHPSVHSYYGRVFPHLQSRFRYLFSRHGCYTHFPPSFTVDLATPCNKFTINLQRTNVETGGNRFRTLTTIINSYPVEQLHEQYPPPQFKMNILPPYSFDYFCPEECYNESRIAAEMNQTRLPGESLWKYQIPDLLMKIDTEEKIEIEQEQEDESDDGAVTYASIVRRNKRKNKIFGE